MGRGPLNIHFAPPSKAGDTVKQDRHRRARAEGPFSIGSQLEARCSRGFTPVYLDAPDEKMQPVDGALM